MEEGEGQRNRIRPGQLAPVAAASSAITIWLAALGLLTTPFMLHQLGASAYAVFALITIMAAYLSNLELGFGHATLRFLARAHASDDRDAERRIVATSLFVFGFAGAGAALVALAGAPAIGGFAQFPADLEDEAIGAIRLAALVLVFTLLTSFAQVALQALGRFRPLLWSRLVFGTLLSASAVGAAALFDDVRAVLAAQVVVTLTTCFVLLAVLSGATSARLRPALDRATFRMMAGYGALVLATGLATQAMLQGPPTVLAGSAPSAELAAFAVPAVVFQQLLLLVGAASTGFLPFASAESVAENRERLAAVFRSHVRLTVAVMGPIVGFLVVFAEPLLDAWVGAGFASQAAGPLQLLALAGLAVALSAPPADAARALGRPGSTLAFTLLAGTTGILAALLLVEGSGATGAALGLLTGVWVATPPFLFLIAGRLLKQSSGQLFLALAGPALASLVASGLFWLGSLAIPGFLGAALAGVVVAPAYVLALFRLVLDDRERETLRAGARVLAPLAGFTRLLAFPGRARQPAP
ncbi:MAG: oligosaccharide flippase family protein [Solirubrobacterales bacterium]